jgi:hypothetical protein
VRLLEHEALVVLNGLLASAFASTSVKDLGSLRSPAESIGGSVKRIVQDLYNAAVRRRFPGDLIHINIAHDEGHLSPADRNRRKT